MKDVIALIEQDHRDMEQMFARLQSGDGDRAMLFEQLAAVLTAHSRAEEAEVYPTLAKADADEAKHARQEHAEADDLLAKLKSLDPDGAEFTTTLAKLIEGVQHHIQEEETSALPALRAAADAAKLDQLAEAFTKRRGEELRTGPSPRQVGGTEVTKDELYEKATEHDIPGRSQMNKEELFEAVKEAKKSE
jgi:hemerythrin-like domain-containing protein